MHGQLVVPGALLPRVLLSQRGSLETPKNNSNCGIFRFHKSSIHKKVREKGEREVVSERTVQRGLCRLSQVPRAVALNRAIPDGAQPETESSLLIM